jgi:hypothetical protein
VEFGERITEILIDKNCRCIGSVEIRRVKPLGRSRCRWKNNIRRMNLRKIGWEVWTRFIWLRIGNSGGLL